MAYKTSRNIEASCIDFVKAELASAWSNVNVEKTFSRVYEISLPTVCIRCGTTEHPKVQLGDNATVRTASVLIDIFTSSDGLRLDLKDFLISKLKHGMPYYEYIIVSGQIQSKTQNGRLRVLSISDTPLNFDVDKDKLDIHDRYRHLLTLEVSLGKVEA